MTCETETKTKPEEPTEAMPATDAPAEDEADDATGEAES